MGHTFAIGDVHGCYETFRRLLTAIHFNPKHDRLWFVGDLVGRGPRSLEMLRWVIDHDAIATVVLGNHDVHLIACSDGVRSPKPEDRLEGVLNAPDRATLIDYLARRSLIHRDRSWLMIHAGLLPAWTAAEAATLAALISTELSNTATRAEFLRRWYGTSADDWTFAKKSSEQKLFAALSAFTRMRICTADNRIDGKFSGTVAEIPVGFAPWFTHYAAAHPTRDSIIFGHWAALGLHIKGGFYGLDSGCHWGRSLTALRLDDRAIVQQPNID